MWKSCAAARNGSSACVKPMSCFGGYPGGIARQYPRRSPSWSFSGPTGRPGMRSPSAAPSWLRMQRSPARRSGSATSARREEKRVAGRHVSVSADRRENRGAGRLARRNARSPALLDQGSRCRRGRGVEVGWPGLVARRTDLHRRDVQEGRKADLRQGCGAEGSFAPLQFQPRGKHAACHRRPRGREDRREGIQGPHQRRRDPEQVAEIGGTMAPDPTTPAGAGARSETRFKRVLGGMSVFTMLMTVPQVWNIWVGHQAAGVSVVSWSAYLLSALLWSWYGLQKRDRNIYLPCVGWVGLDAAVIVGAMVYA